jgi:hypothetical protein
MENWLHHGWRRRFWVQIPFFSLLDTAPTLPNAPGVKKTPSSHRARAMQK